MQAHAAAEQFKRWNIAALLFFCRHQSSSNTCPTKQEPLQFCAKKKHVKRAQATANSIMILHTDEQQPLCEKMDLRLKETCSTSTCLNVDFDNTELIAGTSV